MQNEVEKKGRIFFPDFCKLSLRKFREFDETHFRQELFKVVKLARAGEDKQQADNWHNPTLVLALLSHSILIYTHLSQIICGTEPHPSKYRAKKYKVEEKFFSFTDFR